MLRDPLNLRFMMLEGFFHVPTLLAVSPKVPYCIILKVITDRWYLRQHVYPSRMWTRMRRIRDGVYTSPRVYTRPPFGVLCSGFSYNHYHAVSYLVAGAGSFAWPGFRNMLAYQKSNVHYWLPKCFAWNSIFDFTCTLPEIGKNEHFSYYPVIVNSPHGLSNTFPGNQVSYQIKRTYFSCFFEICLNIIIYRQYLHMLNCGALSAPRNPKIETLSTSNGP